MRKFSGMPYHRIPPFLFTNFPLRKNLDFVKGGVENKKTT